MSSLNGLHPYHNPRSAECFAFSAAELKPTELAAKSKEMLEHQDFAGAEGLALRLLKIGQDPFNAKFTINACERLLEVYQPVHDSRTGRAIHAAPYQPPSIKSLVWRIRTVLCRLGFAYTQLPTDAEKAKAIPLYMKAFMYGEQHHHWGEVEKGLDLELGRHLESIGPPLTKQEQEAMKAKAIAYHEERKAELMDRKLKSRDPISKSLDFKIGLEFAELLIKQNKKEQAGAICHEIFVSALSAYRDHDGKSCIDYLTLASCIRLLNQATPGWQDSPGIPVFPDAIERHIEGVFALVLKTLGVMRSKAMQPLSFGTPVLRNMYVFGQVEWEHHFGDVGTIPPIDPRILHIFSRSCPYLAHETTPKIWDTHMLFAIPTHINGELFNLEWFFRRQRQSLIKRDLDEVFPRLEYPLDFHPGVGLNTPMGPPTWVLMPNRLVPATAADFPKSGEESISDPAYREASLLELLTAMLISKRRIFTEFTHGFDVDHKIKTLYSKHCKLSIFRYKDPAPPSKHHQLPIPGPMDPENLHRIKTMQIELGTEKTSDAPRQAPIDPHKIRTVVIEPRPEKTSDEPPLRHTAVVRTERLSVLTTSREATDHRDNKLRTLHVSLSSRGGDSESHSDFERYERLARHGMKLF